MALSLGELTAGLRADDTQFTRSLTTAELAMRGLTRDVNGQLRDMHGRFVNEGQGMGRSLSYNIGRGARTAVGALRTVGVAMMAMSAVAAVASVGAAGALAAIPLAVIGIGAKILAENEQVKSAFSDLGKHVKTELTQLAQPLVKPFVEAAGQLRTIFDQIAPYIGQAFAAAAPMVAPLVDGIGQFATGIMPGFVEAMESAQPVIEALASGLGSIGSGLGGFFEGLAGGSDGAAQGLGALMDTVGVLLPAVGELLGTLATLGGPILAGVMVAIEPLIGMVQQLAEWFGQLIAKIPPDVLMAIGAGFTAIALGVKAYGLYTRLAAAATTGWAVAQGIFNAVLAANPIGLIIGLIVGLGVALVIAYQKSETFREIVQGVWTAVKEAISASIEWIKGALEWFGELPGKIGGWFGSAKDAAVAKFTELTTWLGGLPGRAGAALGGLAGTLSASASKGFQSFRDAAVQKAAAFGVWVAGWPGRISKAIGSLNSLLYSKGVAVVQGLWNGIKAMGGWLKDTLFGWVSDVIPGPIAKALGIASPSKVTKAQGRWIARGLVEGLTGSQKQVRAASYKLVDVVRDALTGSREAKALRAINSSAGKLDWLAGWDAKIGAQLKTARKKLADLRKNRDKLAADVKKGILDSANITQQDTGGWAPTAETILAGLKADTAAAQTFAKNLAILRKKGVRSDLIAQIAQAGVEQGGATAQALANANGSQISQINQQQKALVDAAGQAGTTAGNAMYGAGIKAAEGLVHGLASHQKQIEQQMLKIAQGMKAAIKKALGIKSPSTVMAALGRYIPQGLVQGIEAGRPAVDKTMASLVSTPSPSALARSGSLDSASARTRAAAAQRVVLELRSSGRPEDDYLIEKVRRGVRRKGGPNAGFVLTGRRGGG